MKDGCQACQGSGRRVRGELKHGPRILLRCRRAAERSGKEAFVDVVVICVRLDSSKE